MSDEDIDFSLAEQAARPQYVASEEFLLRFLDAAHNANSIALTRSILGTTKAASNLALAADNLEWFVDQKATLENEFFGGLVERIGPSKAKDFIDLVTNCWFDGRASRTKGKILDLTRSVGCYARRVAKPGVQLVASEPLPSGPELLTEEEIAAVLTLNQQMLQWAIDDWIASRPQSEAIARDEIYVVRGVALNSAPNPGGRFQELNYIASYSLAISVGEQFAQTGRGTPTLIHAPLDVFRDRTLFFSPFMPGLKADQFELGVIPGADLDVLTFQQHRDGAAEYILADMPL